MTLRVEIPPRLQEWAARAGYTLTLQSDGRAEFWSLGGEVRHLIGARDDGWFIVTYSERLGPEEFQLAAASMDTVERYFYGDFGRTVRSRQGLPDVHMPIEREQTLPGFTIDTRPFEGTERLALISADGHVVAASSGGKMLATMRLVLLSLYLTASIDDIEASSLDAEGRPLLRPR